ncbi:putative nuclease HARBI1 [Myzus persicae]|uniref:putative nuclease HARBI1 n=1 Tax=Myzus persicae TaxID=13164 RepID=UPI000B934EFB|nr:putative nuclease HARBI1 [Myzus persicae]
MAPYISKTNRPVKIPLDIQLLGFLWIMATSDCYRSVAERFKMNRGTLHKVYRTIVSCVVYETHRYIQWSTDEKKDEITDAFLVASGYPGIVGAIDGSYIKIKQPRGDKHYRYANRKKDYAVIIQGVCSYNKKLLDVHIGEVGNEHIIGNSAYPIGPHMMVPYKDNGALTAKQKSHNIKLSKGRVKIENTWAQLKGKWRRLKYLDTDRMDYIVDHICASCVLHNVALDGSDDEYCIEENEEIDVFEERNVDLERMKREGQIKRDRLADLILNN